MEGQALKIGPDRFFDGKNFLGEQLAEVIMKHRIFKTMRDNQEVFYYKEGIFVPDGEALIAEEAQKILNWRCTNNRVHETVGHIKRMTFMDREELDCKTDIICLKNKVYNLKTNEDLNHSPGFLLTNQMPVVLDRDAKCSRILKFLEEILHSKDIPVIQELLGYLLLRKHHIHKAFLFLGNGSNGKSTLINLIKTFVGKDNITAIALQDLDRNRFAVAQLFGKIANLYPDISDSSLMETGRFKAITGEDTISAEKKFKSHFTFKNYSKQIFSANKLPVTRDKSYAFYRRIVLIDFPNRFEGKNANKNLIIDLTTQEELSGLFNWAVIGLQRLLENSDFSYEKTTEEIKSVYERRSSSVAAFIQDRVDFNIYEIIPKGTLYTAFVDYCKQEEVVLLENNAFGRKLKEHVPGLEECRIGNVPAYRGLKLKKEEV